MNWGMPEFVLMFDLQYPIHILSWQVEGAAVKLIYEFGIPASEATAINNKRHSNMKYEKGHTEELLTVCKIHLLRYYKRSQV